MRTEEKRNIQANCLGSCIIDHLNKAGHQISEADLYCNESMLTTYFCNTTDSLATPIEELLVEDIKKMGMKLKRVKEIDINKLDTLIKDEHMIILNISSRHLTYSDTYKKTPTTLTNHFINIYTGIKGEYYICDAYIPTIPISSYEGDFLLTETILNECEIYTLQCDHLILHENDYKLHSIACSLKNYKNDKNEENPFQQLKTKLKSGDLSSKIIFEMAVGLLTGGVLATRILFVENARSVVYLNEEFNQEYEGLKDNYFTLRLHLLKYSCTKSERDLDIIIQKINTVETMEVNLLNKIHYQLKEVDEIEYDR